eukprot:TRINITY_DN18140_c0_g1_i2.p1 TRINITY_DN18140_c0_g1~~TRINITY_DN18140_c0_g1_i2.p1  ORF type:complete len:373 (+),score=62.12 TRINITY_DN18140_c0_g1_i2:1004-2122(+)
MREEQDKKLAEVREEAARAQAAAKGKSASAQNTQKGQLSDQEARERALCRLGLLGSAGADSEERQRRRRLKGHDFSSSRGRDSPVFFTNYPEPHDLIYEVPQWPPQSAPPAAAREQRRLPPPPPPVFGSDDASSPAASPSAAASGLFSPRSPTHSVLDHQCAMGRTSGRVSSAHPQRAAPDPLRVLMHQQERKQQLLARSMARSKERGRRGRRLGPDPPTWEDLEYWIEHPDKGGLITWKDDCILSPQLQSHNVMSTSERRLRKLAAAPSWGMRLGREDLLAGPEQMRDLRSGCDAAIHRLPWRETVAARRAPGGGRQCDRCTAHLAPRTRRARAPSNSAGLGSRGARAGPAHAASSADPGRPPRPTAKGTV